jgi:DNA-binding NtrC family response regulator
MQGQNRVRRRMSPLGDRDGSGIDCVVLTCFQDEWRTIATLLRYGGVRSHCAETTEQADFLLTVTGSTVLFSDVMFLDGSWVDALRMCAHLHPCVLTFVIADFVDRAFVSDAPDHGACGTLWKPLSILKTQKLIEVADEAARERRCNQQLPTADHCQFGTATQPRFPGHATPRQQH